MLWVRRMSSVATAVKLQSFALIINQFYSYDYHPTEADTSICDALTADGIKVEPFELFWH
jgi:hypothetical protein